ncbi:lectin-like [Hemitrygon akajei]|uniref:lectin-like n=1 Tax=Hemitrygon akajei TaxID=2704970 RepID=UPI003BF97F9A
MFSSALSSETRLLLLIAIIHCWDLQAADPEPEVHVPKMITEQKEHRRLKREKFCDVWCLPNWDLHNDTCYRVLKGFRTWVESEIYCQSLVPGGHLASLHSLETSEFIADLSWSTISSQFMWVGVSEKYKPGTFLWTDGSQWDYFDWQSGSPSAGLINYNCVLLICTGLDIYKMKSADCTLGYPAVCQYKAELD